MTRHYLDHASSSPLRPSAAAAIRDFLAYGGADPGRIHEEGRIARDAVETARQHVADLVGVRSRQVIFTSGGTEAINMAAVSAAAARPHAPIAAAMVEHSAVRESAERVTSTIEMPVDHLGRIDADAAGDICLGAVTPALINCQWANHEVGTIQPVSDVVRFARTAGVPIHIDACAAIGHELIDLAALEADFVSISAHKMGGPPGVGALIVGRSTRVTALVVGGAQERHRRAGMENVLGIVGFGAVAAELAANSGKQLEIERDQHRTQTARLRQQVDQPWISLLGDLEAEWRLPHIVCLGVDGVEAEAIVIGLDRGGVAIHSGSACASEELEPSPVLEAMGADPSHSVRISLGWSTTDEDIDALVAVLGRVTDELRSLRF